MKINYFLFHLKSMNVFCVLNLTKGHITLLVPARSLGGLEMSFLITTLQGTPFSR